MQLHETTEEGPIRRSPVLHPSEPPQDGDTAHAKQEASQPEPIHHAADEPHGAQFQPDELV